VNEVGEACGTHGRGEEIVQGVGGKAQRKRQPRRLRLREENGIKVDCRGTAWEDLEWIHLAQERDW
jgi:hypothetical protein